MMKRKRIYVLISLLCLGANLWSQSAHKQLREGNNAYAQGHFNKSEEKYRQAGELAGRNKQQAEEQQRLQKARYNMANAIFQQKRYDEAAKQYENLLEQNNMDNDWKAATLHNLGNAQYEQKKFDKAIESYKKALDLKPNDLNTKQNLANALHQKKQRQQQQQQPQNQPPPPQNQDKKQQKQPDEPKNAPNNMQTEQMLKIMNEEERKVQQRMQKGKPSTTRPMKDW